MLKVFMRDWLQTPRGPLMKPGVRVSSAAYDLSLCQDFERCAIHLMIPEGGLPKVRQ